MIIDSYTHIIPEEYSKAMMSSSGLDLDFFEMHPRAGYEHFIDGSARIRQMDKFGIDVHVLDVPYVSPDFDMKLYRTVNDGMSRIVEKYHDRFEGIGTVTLTDVGSAVEEANRIVQELGLKGVMIPAAAKGVKLDSPALSPFFSAIERLGVPIFLMPADPASYPDLDDYAIGRIFGWPFNTTQALATLALGGVLEDHPNLKVVARHLGGMISFYAKRIEGFATAPKYAEVMKRKLRRPVLDYFKMIKVDTAACGNAAAIECATSFFGVDNVLYGTDYPMGPNQGAQYLTKILESIKTSPRLSDDEKQKVLGGNATALLGLE